MYTFKTPLEERPLFLNRFNPTLKVICAIILIVLTFLKVDVIFQLSIFVLILGLWFSARLPKRKFKSIIRTILFLFFFIFLFNWLLSKNPGLKFDIDTNYTLWGASWNHSGTSFFAGHYYVTGEVWGGWVGFWQLPKPSGQYIAKTINGIKWYLPYFSPLHSLTSQVLINSVSICIKLFCMLTVFSLLVNTTSTLQLTYAFEHIFWPLKWIKVPVTEISYIISVAIRFVPNLFDEANKIIRAQANRGLDFKNGKLITKIKAVGSLVIPMFAASFDHADKLSDAMEARNFAPRAKRTKYRHFPCRASNWASFAILICLFGFFIYLRVRKVIIYPFIAIDCFNI